MKKHILTERQLCDLELIQSKAFHPLQTFMGSQDYQSVLRRNRLANGDDVWTVPIYLTCAAEPVIGDIVRLHKKDSHAVAQMTVKEVFDIDVEMECDTVYGTRDLNHPGVRYLVEESQSAGTKAITGTLDFFEDMQRAHIDHAELRISPDECKQRLKEAGWKNVIGFQTRNPLHNSHIQLIKNALSSTKDAGVFIHPAVGPTQPGDIDHFTRIKCYKAVMEEYSQALPLILSILPLAMRMAGPREAILHAIIRRNHGCTHFIMGRDPAGPSSKRMDGTLFYDPYAAHELAESFGSDLGIHIIKSPELSFSPSKMGFFPTETLNDVTHISGTEFRRRLRQNEDIPAWFSIPKVISILREHTQQMGTCIYLMGLSGSGKTTLANHLKDMIREQTTRNVVVLDGDEVRRNLSHGLGFSREDRSTNVRRIGYTASLIVQTGGLVICANIAPYEEDRQWIRDQMRHYNYVEVFVNTPLDVCEKRDVKGLYRKARLGLIPKFTGISDPFEIPQSETTLILDTQQKTPSECVSEILSHIHLRTM